MPFCQCACHRLRRGHRSRALTFALGAWNEVSSVLQHMSDKEWRKRWIGFEKASNTTGDDRRCKTGALHVLIVRSDQFQICNAPIGDWIPLLTTNKQILCFLGNRGIGKHRCRYPDAWRNQVRLGHLVAGAAVVAVPEGNFVVAENVLIINSAHR